MICYVQWSSNCRSCQTCRTFTSLDWLLGSICRTNCPRLERLSQTEVEYMYSAAAVMLQCLTVHGLHAVCSVHCRYTAWSVQCIGSVSAVYLQSRKLNYVNEEDRKWWAHCVYTAHLACTLQLYSVPTVHFLHFTYVHCHFSTLQLHCQNFCYGGGVKFWP